MRASRLSQAILPVAASYRPMPALSQVVAGEGQEVLRSLFEARFQEYFGSLLGGNALWLFCHVPKTAGSSLNGELLPLLKPAFHIFIDYAEVDAKPYAALFDDAVGRFIDAAHLRRYRYATGHILAEHVERIASEVANVRPITLLRDPVARFVSDYRYQRSPMHPGHEAFSAQFPTIEPYLELPGEWNKIAAHLLPQGLREEADPQACADYLISTFAFIGIQELYPLTLRVLTTMAGSPQLPKVFRRLNAATPENPMELSPATEDAIRARNTLDIAIYDAVATRFRAISQGLEDYLDRVAPMRA